MCMPLSRAGGGGGVRSKGAKEVLSPHSDSELRRRRPWPFWQARARKEKPTSMYARTHGHTEGKGEISGEKISFFPSSLTRRRRVFSALSTVEKRGKLSPSSSFPSTLAFHAKPILPARRGVSGELGCPSDFYPGGPFKEKRGRRGRGRSLPGWWSRGLTNRRLNISKKFSLCLFRTKKTFCFVNDSFNRYLLQTEYEYKSMPPRCCPFPPDMRRPLCDPPSAISRRKRSETTMEKEGRVHDGD